MPLTRQMSGVRVPPRPPWSRRCALAVLILRPLLSRFHRASIARRLSLGQLEPGRHRLGRCRSEADDGLGLEPDRQLRIGVRQRTTRQAPIPARSCASPANDVQPAGRSRPLSTMSWDRIVNDVPGPHNTSTTVLLGSALRIKTAPAEPAPVLGRTALSQVARSTPSAPGVGLLGDRALPDLGVGASSIRVMRRSGGTDEGWSQPLGVLRHREPHERRPE